MVPITVMGPDTAPSPGRHLNALRFSVATDRLIFPELSELCCSLESISSIIKDQLLRTLKSSHNDINSQLPPRSRTKDPEHVPNKLSLKKAAPKAIGRTNSALLFCELSNLKFSLHPPRESYIHGWGRDCHNARLVIRSWTVTVIDISDSSTTLNFDIIHRDAPLLIGLDLLCFSNCHNRADTLYILSSVQGILLREHFTLTPFLVTKGTAHKAPCV